MSREALQESLSALMDNEADELELRRVLAACGEDAEMRAAWSRYQLVGNENQTGPSIKGTWVQRKTPEGRLVWESQDVRQQSNAVIDAVLARWEQAQQPDFLALELGPRSVSIVWNEKGDSAETEALCLQLEELMTA